VSHSLPFPATFPCIKANNITGDNETNAPGGWLGERARGVGKGLAGCGDSHANGGSQHSQVQHPTPLPCRVQQARTE